MQVAAYIHARKKQTRKDMEKEEEGLLNSRRVSPRCVKRVAGVCTQRAGGYVRRVPMRHGDVCEDVHAARLRRRRRSWRRRRRRRRFSRGGQSMVTPLSCNSPIKPPIARQRLLLSTATLTTQQPRLRPCVRGPCSLRPRACTRKPLQVRSFVKPVKTKKKE